MKLKPLFVEITTLVHDMVRPLRVIVRYIFRTT
jgi:hypothetical protein